MDIFMCLILSKEPFWRHKTSSQFQEILLWRLLSVLRQCLSYQYMKGSRDGSVYVWNVRSGEENGMKFFIHQAFAFYSTGTHGYQLDEYRSRISCNQMGPRKLNVCNWLF